MARKEVPSETKPSHSYSKAVVLNQIAINTQFGDSIANQEQIMPIWVLKPKRQSADSRVLPMGSRD